MINPDLSECGPHGDQWSITYTWALVPDADARHLAIKCYEQRKPSTRVLRRATVQTGFLRIPTWLMVLEFSMDIIPGPNTTENESIRFAHGDANFDRRRFSPRSFLMLLSLFIGSDKPF